MGRGGDFGRIREEPENKLTQRRKGAKVKTEIEIAAKRRKKRKKKKVQRLYKAAQASRWEDRFVRLAGQYLKGGSLLAIKRRFHR
jgi:hypothetical protein